ncbi:hypothetical protein PDE_02293 [Penicillium oxalicum 114-2]|uniref:NACHT-NTPase and P-loop NTPases N-terminal domain-containing protein n=1 Tax=Penicillium oxalicum (strain 114-2 / CGMCC 5302) TaxID=933388 RepID=S7Z9V7_PENO1|nr:hypothetical protein PDE_02293 [Penicillium oxalicum 114-2]
MAEVVAAVAVISSFVQLADSSAKLASRIHEYIRQTESAPKNLCRIYDLLPVFIEALKWIEDPVVLSDLDPGTQSTMRQLIDRRSSQLTGLEAMVTKLMPGRSDSKRRRVYKAFLSTKDERNLEKISCDIKDDIHMLISLSNLIVSVQNSRISSESPKSSKLISLPTINTSVEKGGTQSLDIANTSPRTRFRSFAGQYNRDQRREYSYFFGLAKLGLMYAFQAKLEISWGRPTFSITPSLSLQPLVKRTSPGAVIFYRFLHTGDDNKLSSLQFMSNKLAKQALSESCLVLSRNLMSKKLSPWDVFPSGLTLLEVGGDHYQKCGHHTAIDTFLRKFCTRHPCTPRKYASSL